MEYNNCITAFQYPDHRMMARRGYLLTAKSGLGYWLLFEIRISLILKGLAVTVIQKPYQLLPLALAAACAVWPWAVAAFDAGKMEDFKTTNVCKYCDLTDAPLGGRDMRGADFQNANLSGAVLTKANLSGADLGDAVLLNANMKGAVLAGANLKGAKMDGAKLDDAKFCKTVMPDGAVNDSGC